MSQDHYKTLGVARNATANEIKSAYRKIVLQHHPDKSSTAASADLFRRSTDAYEIIGDNDRRKHYDATMDFDRRRVQQSQRDQATTQASQTKAQPRPETRTQTKVQDVPKVSPVAADVTRLTLIFTRGQYAESEKLARQILGRDSRQPIPYAVLGDLARAKGNLDEAAKMYAYAAQMDPRNPVYQQRHEELISTVRGQFGKSRTVAEEGKSVMTLVVGALLLVSCALYVILAKENPIAPGLALISTWTLGLAVMLFLAGVTIGAVLCSSNHLDRFSVSSTNSLGKVSSPMVALTSIAIVNFWAAAALYGGMTLAQRGYNQSHLRFMVGIGASVLIMTAATAMSPYGINAVQVLIWGGNVAYIGGICGWMVADSFKRI